TVSTSPVSVARDADLRSRDAKWWGRTTGPPPTALLAEQGEDALGRLVGLREHARAGLLQDVELREPRHLSRHVHVTDTRLGSGQVLLVGGQVVQAMLEAVLHGAVV